MSRPLYTSRIKLPSGQIYWREWGQGPTILFLHGTWQTARQWDQLINLMEPAYRFVSIDLPGFGDSICPVPPQTIAQHVRMVDDFLTALRLPEVYLVGHSLGSWVAASYAVRHADRVKGLMLMSPEGLELPNDGRDWTKKRRELRHKPLSWSLQEAIAPLTEINGRPSQARLRAQAREMMLANQSLCDLIYGRSWPEIQGEQLNELISELAVPLLILQGQEDEARSIEMSQVYRDLAPHAQLRSMAGDTDLIDQYPEVVAEEFHGFIQSLIEHPPLIEPQPIRVPIHRPTPVVSPQPVPVPQRLGVGLALPTAGLGSPAVTFHPHP
jgi:pimeloyl-ACP methyl ester carboxylesterase